MKKSAVTHLALVLTLAFGTLGLAADEGNKQTPPTKPVVKETVLSGAFNGKKITYRAVAGETRLKDKNGTVNGTIFSTSYIREGVKDKTKRPVFFVYNGGPGSASVWLHMGVFGPKRINIPSDARDDGAGPYELTDNAASILDVTDLVFIDPVGTGFSRTEGDGKTKDFWGVGEDAKSVAQFIRVWLRTHGRWNSPKYIGGESYGTTRSAAVVRELEGRFDDVAVNGIILISTILDFTIDSYDPGNELVHVMYLPTMASTAQYHGKAGTGKSVADFAEEARTWAIGEYGPALLLGADLTGERRAAIRARLAYFTGLSETYLEEANLRVHYQRFNKELLRADGLSIGRLDSRYTGKDFDRAGERPDTDPSFYGIDGAYTAAINSWLREGLNFNPDREYTIIGGVNNWNWELPTNHWAQSYLNVAPYIGTAMRGNSDLRVFNAAGYYDFATPYFGAEYSLNRNGIDPTRVTYKYYEAGHMMYIHHPSLKALLIDVRAFIKAGAK